MEANDVGAPLIAAAGPGLAFAAVTIVALALQRVSLWALRRPW